jgi:hypothetical protein
MEDLFDASLRATTLDGKTFNPKNDQDTATQYGKMAFADKVVRANLDRINFSSFIPIFNRIWAVMVHYSAHKPPSASP